MEDKKHGRVIDKILSFPSIVEDFESWCEDLDHRNGNVVGNGRVYKRLDIDDVFKKCAEKNLSPREIVLVRSEFDENRLNNVWDHCCEMESDYYVDWRAGCAHTDYVKQANLYARYLRYQEEECTECYLEETAYPGGKNNPPKYRSRLKYHHKEFQDYQAKGWTRKELWNHFQKKHKQEIKEREYLEFLGTNPRDIWGGKYPVIAEVGTIALHTDSEVEDLVYFIEQAEGELTNKAFYGILCGREQRYTNFNSVKEVLEQINYWTERFDFAQKAVEFVNEYIKSVTSDWKNVLLGQLDHEIEEFLSDNFSIEERIREGVAKFDTLVKIDGNYAVTNQNAHAPVDEIKSIITDYRNGQRVDGRKVGHYTINQIFKIEDEDYFKIGCHLFRLKDVEQKLAV
jgi:uncharacterized protein YciU (UPF0263 family)